MRDADGIKGANYVQGRPFVVLIHGYTGHKDYSPSTHIRPALFQNDDYNVISIDYNPLAQEPCYVQAVHNLPVVAKCTAQLLDYMMENQLFTLDDLHIIGFSLGAQTAGMISNFVRTGKLRRIVGRSLVVDNLKQSLNYLITKKLFNYNWKPNEGLDPAKPMFVFADAEHRLGMNFL